MKIAAIDRKRTLQMQLGEEHYILLLQGSSQASRVLHRAEAAAYEYSSGNEDIYRYELQNVVEEIIDLRRALKGLDLYNLTDSPSYDFHDDESDADETLAAVAAALEADMTKEQRRAYAQLWMPPDVATAYLEGQNSSSYRVADMVSVRRVANSYLATPWWQDDEIEWILANALVTLEAQSFGEESKKGIGEQNIFKILAAEKLYRDTGGDVSKMARKRLWKSLPAAMGRGAVKLLVSILAVAAGAAIAADSISSNYGQVLLALIVGYLLYRLWRPREEQTPKHAELLQAMFYAALPSLWSVAEHSRRGAVIGAEAIRQAMETATMKGASWLSEALVLVAQAANKPFPGWVITGDCPRIGE